MSKSIERLAMDIAGKETAAARFTLKRFDFSLAEVSEIITANTVARTFLAEKRTMSKDWRAIAGTIKSTIETSFRLGDRIDLFV